MYIGTTEVSQAQLSIIETLLRDKSELEAIRQIRLVSKLDFQTARYFAKEYNAIDKSQPQIGLDKKASRYDFGCKPTAVENTLRIEETVLASNVENTFEMLLDFYKVISMRCNSFDHMIVYPIVHNGGVSLYVKVVADGIYSFLSKEYPQVFTHELFGMFNHMDTTLGFCEFRAHFTTAEKNKTQELALKELKSYSIEYKRYHTLPKIDVLSDSIMIVND